MRAEQEARNLEDFLGANRYWELERKQDIYSAFVLQLEIIAPRRDRLLLLCPVR